VPSRRLEDQIKDLCSKAVAANEAELHPILLELRETLHEHANRLKKLAAQKLMLKHRSDTD
jgi:hypothetical protein